MPTRRAPSIRRTAADTALSAPSAPSAVAPAAAQPVLPLPLERPGQPGARRGMPVTASCGGCGHQWIDPDVAHCARCHRTWPDVAGFDAHLRECAARAAPVRTAVGRD